MKLVSIRLLNKFIDMELFSSANIEFKLHNLRFSVVSFHDFYDHVTLNYSAENIIEEV